MSDLYDIARPIRDAAVAETIRALAPDATESCRDGALLSAHLVAVVMAWGHERGADSGTVKGATLLEALAYAMGLMLGNAGMMYRPTINGDAITPVQSVRMMILRAAPTAVKLAAMAELGIAEVSMPIGRQADGSLGPQGFDFMDMLGGKR